MLLRSEKGGVGDIAFVFVHVSKEIFLAESFKDVRMPWPLERANRTQPPVAELHWAFKWQVRESYNRGVNGGRRKRARPGKPDSDQLGAMIGRVLAPT